MSGGGAAVTLNTNKKGTAARESLSSSGLSVSEKGGGGNNDRHHHHHHHHHHPPLLTHNNDTFYSHVDVLASVSGSMGPHEQKALSLQHPIWEFTGTGVVFVAGVPENRVSVLFQQLRFEEGSQSYSFVVVNAGCERLVLNREPVRLILFSLPTRSVSGQSLALNPPLVEFPPALRTVCKPFVIPLSKQHVFVRAKICGPAWYTGSQLGVAVDPSWRLCSVAVTHVPEGLERMQERMLRRMDAYGPVAEDDDVHLDVYKVAYKKNVLYMLLVCMPRTYSESALAASAVASADTILFSGVFNRRPQPAAELHKPSVAVAFNTTCNSVADGYVPVIDPYAHINQFTTPTRDTVGLFVPDCCGADARALYHACTWSSHKMFLPKVDTAGQISSSLSPPPPSTTTAAAAAADDEGEAAAATEKMMIASAGGGGAAKRPKKLAEEVGRIFFLCRERAGVPVKDLHAPPDEVSVVVSQTHMVLHPLGVLVRLDALNPICVSPRPQKGFNPAQTKARAELQHISEHFSNLYLEEIRMLNSFLGGEHRTAVEATVAESRKFVSDAGPWVPWNLCDHQYKQDIRLDLRF
ncbi:protein ORF-F2 [Proboscivirus elephantidbeta4]|uniref:Protein ORF-F2 n=1 Tax=Elephant endotheliotropic herpesvirus 4 TaxID=548914 RepID=A0A0S1TP25_9BETA|nr:protein ORF-F2 [Elephant endotheliotropic herpesvirus 4]ALM25954.1 protein ORF-F2 [Elephant endotheliotropic herpesvirus 4]